MICIGIDVAKDRHDCFIISSGGKVPENVFTIPNSKEGFEQLLQKIQACTAVWDNIKVGLEQPGTTATTFSCSFLITVFLPMF